MKNKEVVKHYLDGVVKEFEEMLGRDEIYVRLTSQDREEIVYFDKQGGVKFELEVYVKE